MVIKDYYNMTLKELEGLTFDELTQIAILINEFILSQTMAYVNI